MTDPVLALLQDRLGIAPEAVGPEALRSAVRGRMARLGLDAPTAYARRLDAHPDEFLALVEDVVVSESWFFRGAELFAHVVDHAQKKNHGPGGTFRVLSAPCGAGQEPYSVAIALTEAGLPPATWSIDALDISPRNLNQAHRGVYGALAFREMSPVLRDRYFRPAPEGFALTEAIRRMPHFQQGNLLDPLLLQGGPLYDFILCRNVLIYLHSEARLQMLATLKRLLAPGGRIATGTAESLTDLDPEFVPAGPIPFVYRLATETDAAPRPLPRPTTAMPPRPVRTVTPVAMVPPPPSEVVATSEPVCLLTRARQHADLGRLTAALKDCAAHLAAAGPSAAALGLLGVLRQSAGDEAEAIRCFRQALYLDPHHEEALVHLMLLCESRGDTAQASRLRQRLQRLRHGGAS